MGEAMNLVVGNVMSQTRLRILSRIAVSVKFFSAELYRGLMTNIAIPSAPTSLEKLVTNSQ